MNSSLTFVKATSVPGIRKSESLKVEVVAELVAKSAEECAERGDLLPHCRPHPYPDQHGFRVVVAEKLARPAFSYAQWPRSKHPTTAARNFVKGSSKVQNPCAGP